MKKAILIGIAGASGSGKTLVAETLLRRLGPDRAVVIQEDAYYKDLSYMAIDMRAQQNFDHPDAFDHDLLATHMRQMLQGDTVSCPIYDYKTHNRKKDTRTVRPHRVILLEGILALSTAQLRKLMDIRVFVDVPLDMCCERRVKRDISERGRTRASVIQQYEQTVQPMYQQYIEPSKGYADILIPQGGKNSVAIDALADGINGLLKKTPH